MTDIYNIVFPGQGSQRPGMGSDFSEKYAESREIFARASEALKEDIAQICFTENEKLDLTEYTQPCILTCSIAMYHAIRTEIPLSGELFAGHSLGEYTALVAAGVFSLEDAVKIVRRRGALMQQAVPAGVGAMAALIADDLQTLDVQKIIEANGAEIANLNSTSQTVISGNRDAVEKASAALKLQWPQIEVIFLNVSAPFHSSLMKSIEREFHDYLSSFSPNFTMEKVGKVASNYSGKLHDEKNLINHLVSQISGSVRWLDNMKLLIANKLPVFEIGPNKPLSKFFGTLGAPVTSVINLRSLKPLLSAVTQK